MSRHGGLHQFVAAVLLTSAQSASLCPLNWNKDDSLPHGINLTKPCPHGNKFPIHKFEVTIPNNPTITEWICVFYGVWPFAIVLFAALDCIRRWCQFRGIHTRDLSFFLFVGVTTLFNSLFLKKLFLEPRPDESCSHTCGFPSGHSTMACSFFTLLFLDGLYRVRPKFPLTPEHARRHEFLFSELPVQSCFNTRARLLVEFIHGSLCGRLVPLAVDDTMDAFDFGVFVFTWGVYLLPVPFSRVVLKDHTPSQVMCGSALGTVYAFVWFFCVRCFQRKFNAKLGQRFGKVFLHNYGLPRFEVYSNTLCMLERLEVYVGCNVGGGSFAGTASSALQRNEQHARERLHQLDGMHKEIDWYRSHNHFQRNFFPVDKLFHDMEMENFRELQLRIEVLQAKLVSSLRNGAGIGAGITVELQHLKSRS